MASPGNQHCAIVSAHFHSLCCMKLIPWAERDKASAKCEKRLEHTSVFRINAASTKKLKKMR